MLNTTPTGHHFESDAASLSRSPIIELSEVKSLLETRLAKLIARMDQIGTAIKERKEPDFDEQAWELAADEVLERLNVEHAAEARLVSTALDRIENGTYGICILCDDPIPIARLKAIPHTATCVDCASHH